MSRCDCSLRVPFALKALSRRSVDEATWRAGQNEGQTAALIAQLVRAYG
jgi:hypothetical protein